MSSNPFAGDLARLIGPHRAVPMPPPSSMDDAAMQRRADSERRALELANAGLPPDPVQSNPEGLPPTRPIEAGAPAIDLIGIDLKAGQVVTTQGRYQLTDDEWALAAKVGIDGIHREVQASLGGLAKAYGVPELMDRMLAQAQSLGMKPVPVAPPEAPAPPAATNGEAPTPRVTVRQPPGRRGPGRPPKATP